MKYDPWLDDLLKEAERDMGRWERHKLLQLLHTGDGPNLLEMLCDEGEGCPTEFCHGSSASSPDVRDGFPVLEQGCPCGSSNWGVIITDEGLERLRDVLAALAWKVRGG